MSRIARLVAAGVIGGGAAQTYETYITSLNLLGRWRCNEIDGTTAANSGSVGAAANGTITSLTLAQTGQMGANEAFDWGAADSRIDIPAAATLTAPTALTYYALIRPDTAGASNAGAIMRWSTTHSFSFSTLNVINAAWAGGGNATTTTTTGLAASTWAFIWLTFDNAGDRKIHLYTALPGGVVTEYSYSSQVAMTGTYQAPATALYIGNNGVSSRNFDGLGDEYGIAGYVLTPAQMGQMALLAGST